MRSKYINAYKAEIALLIMFIVYGLIGKLLISLNRSLDSDSVIAGIVSREIWVHKNLLLSQFYLPSSTPHIFSDILPFHLLPQIISNFDPICHSYNVICNFLISSWGFFLFNF